MVGALLALPSWTLAAEKDINVVEDSKNDNGFLTAAAKHFPNPIRVTSKADLAKKVLASLGRGDCIKKLTLVGHGREGLISTGDGNKTETCKHINGNSQEWKDALKGLKGKFCAGAKIVLWGCNTGGGDAGKKKTQEIADYFGVTVEAQTGKVYGDGTTETGSKTTTTPPGSEEEVVPTPNVCTPGYVPEPKPIPAPASFPALGSPTVFPPIPPSEILAVTFIPASEFTRLFQETDATLPFAESAILSPAGQDYVAANGLTDRDLIQQVVSGVSSDSISDASGLGADLNGAIVFRISSGQLLQYFTFGAYQYVLSGGDFKTSLNATCQGINLFRQLTEQKDATPVTKPPTASDASSSQGKGGKQ